TIPMGILGIVIGETRMTLRNRSDDPDRRGRPGVGTEESETMDGERADLWARLQGFEIDEPAAALDFTGRLARENRWSRDFARRVVEEYKRFAFLAMAAGHPVSPSDQVDQAWHLHLIYTQSYWDE